MIPVQSTKVVVMQAPLTAQATDATTTAYLDCLGYDHAKIIVSHGTAATTAKSFLAFALNEGTNSAAATSIIAFLGTTNTVTTTASGFVIPAYGGTVTNTAKAIVLDVDLRKRERYLMLNLTPGTAASSAVVAILSRGEVEPPASSSVSVTATG